MSSVKLFSKNNIGQFASQQTTHNEAGDTRLYPDTAVAKFDWCLRPPTVYQFIVRLALGLKCPILPFSELEISSCFQNKP
jgi:hypothetical protein